MSKVAKQIIIILALLLLVSVGIALSTLSQKTELDEANAKITTELSEQKKKLIQSQKQSEALAQEKDELSKRAEEAVAFKEDLEDQVDELTGQVEAFQDRIAEMNNKIEKATAAKDEWKNRYKEVQTERDDAIAKLQEKPIQKAAPVVISQTVDQEPDKELESYWADVLQEKAELSLRVGDLENELAESSIEIEELKKENTDLGLEVSYLKNERDEIEQKAKRTQEMIDNLSVDLVREKNNKQFIDEHLGKIKDENLSLRSQVKQLGALKVILERSVSRLQSDKNKIEKKLDETEMIVQSRIDEVSDIRRDIDRKLNGSQSQEIILPPIVVNGNSAIDMPSSEPMETTPVASFESAGSIININQENNFVIIDIGETSGANIGDTFSVYRGSQYIGELEVIQVRKDISAADIKQQSMPLQTGDIIK
ncbi:MAG: hypothetical protein P9M07_08590 [Candidatus Aceula meridiana]|nr:hypothetical protein [Candidatus Aceula meridiana]